MNDDKIILELLDVLKTTKEYISQKARIRHVVYYRKIIFKLLYEYGFSYQYLAGYFNIDRTTVFFAVRTANDLISTNKFFANLYDQANEFLDKIKIEQYDFVGNEENIVMDLFHFAKFNLAKLGSQNYLKKDNSAGYSKRSALLLALIHFGLTTHQIAKTMGVNNTQIWHYITFYKEHDPFQRETIYFDEYKIGLHKILENYKVGKND